jgi:hypothetical protein
MGRTEYVHEWARSTARVMGRTEYVHEPARSTARVMGHTEFVHEREPELWVILSPCMSGSQS